jgi:hypothetical protein
MVGVPDDVPKNKNSIVDSSFTDASKPPWQPGDRHHIIFRYSIIRLGMALLPG